MRHSLESGYSGEARAHGQAATLLKEDAVCLDWVWIKHSTFSLVTEGEFLQADQSVELQNIAGGMPVHWEKQLNYLMSNKNKLCKNSSFLSTSKSKEQALNFIQNKNPKHI